MRTKTLVPGLKNTDEGAARRDPGAAGVAAVGLAGCWNGVALQVDYYAP